jgi:SAM-dependent methyltransferase
LPTTLLRRLLAHPLTSGMALDDPATTAVRRHIIASKPFLTAIYDEWYQMIAAHLPNVPGRVLELGSGAGYLNRFIPGLISSEVLLIPDISLVADARRLPFRDASLSAIVFTDVLHHMTDVHSFFLEACRCLRYGGKVLMIEPWVTPWSRFINTHFHHEPFRPDAREWSLTPSGPLSGANGAIPWIVFVRDRDRFDSEFPSLIVERIRPFLPFRYLVSGGVGMRNLMPGFLHSSWARLEQLLEGRMHTFAMFAFIVLRKNCP